jgi:hypothetical protein
MKDERACFAETVSAALLKTHSEAVVRIGMSRTKAEIACRPSEAPPNLKL